MLFKWICNFFILISIKKFFGDGDPGKWGPVKLIHGAGAGRARGPRLPAGARGGHGGRGRRLGPPEAHPRWRPGARGKREKGRAGSPQRGTSRAEGKKSGAVGERCAARRPWGGAGEIGGAQPGVAQWEKAGGGPAGGGRGKPPGAVAVKRGGGWEVK